MPFQKVLSSTGCLALDGESLRSIVVDLNGLQAPVQPAILWNRQHQTAMVQAWRSFHFGVNSVNMNGYVTCIRQVVALLGCVVLQFFHVFKLHFHQEFIGISFL